MPKLERSMSPVGDDRFSDGGLAVIRVSPMEWIEWRMLEVFVMIQYVMGVDEVAIDHMSTMLAPHSSKRTFIVLQELIPLHHDQWTLVCSQKM
jgi:hypothetical protein